MTFLDLQIGDIVLHTYRFSPNELEIEVAEVINTSVERDQRLCTRTIVASNHFHHTTRIDTMHNDKNATLICKLNSVDEVYYLYPEYFI